jgi:hypothetical protein
VTRVRSISVFAVIGLFLVSSKDRAVDHLCTSRDTTTFWGPATISDFADGVSSDGRGPYAAHKDGVGVSFVGSQVVVTLGDQTQSPKDPRRLRVNLDNPVPRGGSIPLGIITDRRGNLVAQWQVGNSLQNLHDIPVGQTVIAAQMNVSFHVDGRDHILQMGPQAAGHCHYTSNLANGAGTSSGTIYRATRTKWVFDLPAGGVGRLFDIENDFDHAVDRGLYYVRLHYEIGE